MAGRVFPSGAFYEPCDNFVDVAVSNRPVACRRNTRVNVVDRYVFNRFVVVVGLQMLSVFRRQVGSELCADLHTVVSCCPSPASGSGFSECLGCSSEAQE